MDRLVKWLSSDKGQKITDWIIPEFFSFLLEIGKDLFIGVRGKLKLKSLEKNLRKKLFLRILKKYGNEVYYHDLDVFLSTNEIISKVIRNGINVPSSQYRSNSTLVSFYIKQFEELHPAYIRFHFDITNMLQECFEIIFETLNQIEDEKVRVVCNVVKEISGELALELQEISRNVKEINKKINVLIDDKKHKEDIFYYESYLEYIERLYPTNFSEQYILRKIYSKKEETQTKDTYSVLMSERKVLLLGEAGFGKTYESIKLLKSICLEKGIEENLIAFFMPLSEYGRLYLDIREGMKTKMLPFCDGNVENLIEKWLKCGQVVLILDGIDDIVEEQYRSKFVAEVKNISQQYNESYFFITSRLNRYHHELDEFNPYFLTGLDRDIIRRKLQEEGVAVHIPNSYYELFKNPLFFEAGKTILKKSVHRELFNRSVLFEQLILLLYSEWDQKKGLIISQPLGCVEMILALGEFAFKTFEKPQYSLLEFEQEITKLLPAYNSAIVVGTIISFEIIKVTDKVKFTHKLFKEYCVAYYLWFKFSINKNQALYLSLINKEIWKEVFIFIAGMYSNVEEQDEFLDFIMHNNLQLYIECIDAKSDLYSEKENVSYAIYARRYLEQIYKSYIYIVSKYLAPIAFRFEPRPGKVYLLDMKPVIIGSLSTDGRHLTYWFDFDVRGEEDIILIAEDDMPSYYEQFKRMAIKNSRSFKTFGINLILSGLEGDSGRKIAINIIKNQLSDILQERLLWESGYLLCERLDDHRRKIKELRDITELKEIKEWIDEKIITAKKRNPSIVGYSYNNIELFDLKTLIEELLCHTNSLNDLRLPGPDTMPVNGCWIWDLYSREQKKNRIEKYFYFHQLSYIYMVEKNFPCLCSKFSRYQDVPYQNIVLVDFEREMSSEGFYSDPRLQYYYIAAADGIPMKPDIQETSEVLQHAVIHEHMRKSYLNVGKDMHRSISTTTGFSRIIDKHALGENVYKSIKESLEEIFGDIR